MLVRVWRQMAAMRSAATSSFWGPGPWPRRLLPDTLASRPTWLRCGRCCPPPSAPTRSGPRLGVPWVTAADIAAFVTEVLGCDQVMVEHAEVAAMWAVAVPTWRRRTVAMTSEWGTSRLDAVAILEKSLAQQPVSVYDVGDDDKRVLNVTATMAARERQEALEARFAEWVWEESVRAARLAARYNELFNSVVLPTYDGAHLSLAGLAESFVPHPHQRDAVWRIVSEPNVLLGHAVGAGKTATMIMGGQELKRLGLVNKPAFEKALARAEERHKRLLDSPRDDGVSFEATGLDYILSMRHIFIKACPSRPTSKGSEGVAPSGRWTWT